MVYLQPVTNINSNVLLLQSSLIICLPLYLVYRLFKNDNTSNLLIHPHFLAAMLLLIGGSSTFFFWAFIPILYVDNWPYVDLMMDAQVVVNVTIYIGAALVLFFYPKMKCLEHS